MLILKIDLLDSLTQLKTKVAFLERVYNIHSSVEDEVLTLKAITPSWLSVSFPDLV